MIKLEKINKIFNQKKQNELHVLKDITYEFPNKGLIIILGESGSGKSTLLNIISGLDSQTTGCITFNNTTFESYHSKAWDQIRNNNIGFIYQDFLLIEELTVYDNIELSLKMQGRIDVEENINKISKYLRISAYLSHCVSSLSGGEKQRVAIARALAKNPEVLIADEPTGNLDSRNSIETMNIIRSIADEKLVILVTHEDDIASIYADHIIRLCDGVIIEDRKNEVSTLLDIHEEQIIFLKELEQKTSKIDDMNFTIYKENNNFKDLDLKLIERNQTLYFKVDNSKFRNIKLIDKYSEIELVDDYYKPRIFEKVADVISEKNTKIKTKSIIYKDAFKYARRKINKIDYGGKMLYFSLALIGAVVAISIGLLGEIFNYDDQNFIETSRQYVNVTTSDLTYSELLEFENIEGARALNIFTTEQEFILQTEAFYEVRNPILFYAHPSNLSLVDEDSLIYGKMPTNDYQVVIDQFLVEQILFYNQDRGMSNYEDILTSKIILQAYGLPSDYKEDTKLEFEIVGITNDDSPTIWISDSLVFSIVMSSLVDIELFGDDFELISGRLPEYEYELLLHEDSSLIRDGNIPSRVGISSGEYVVVGTYKVVVNGVYYNMRNLMATDIEIMKSAYFYEHDFDYTRSEFLLYSEDINASINELLSNNINARSKYLEDLETYKDFTFDNSFGLFVFSISGLIIAGISVVFVMRSILPARIKEVSVYRALGASKKDIRRLFVTEIFLTTTLSSLLGFIFTTIILITIQNQISTYVEILHYDVISVLIGVVVLYIINITFGLIPVNFLLLRTPAEIIKNHDI